MSQKPTQIEATISDFVHLRCDIQATAPTIEQIGPETITGSALLYRETIVTALDDYLEGKLEAEDLELWAIEIERLSTFYLVYSESDEQAIRSVIYSLANLPDTTKITTSLCSELKKSLL